MLCKNVSVWLVGYAGCGGDEWEGAEWADPVCGPCSEEAGAAGGAQAQV